MVRLDGIGFEHEDILRPFPVNDLLSIGKRRLIVKECSSQVFRLFRGYIRRPSFLIIPSGETIYRSDRNVPSNLVFFRRIHMECGQFILQGFPAHYIHRIGFRFEWKTKLSLDLVLCIIPKNLFIGLDRMGKRIDQPRDYAIRLCFARPFVFISNQYELERTVVVETTSVGKPRIVSLERRIDLELASSDLDKVHRIISGIGIIDSVRTRKDQSTIHTNSGFQLFQPLLLPPRLFLRDRHSFFQYFRMYRVHVSLV